MTVNIERKKQSKKYYQEKIKNYVKKYIETERDPNCSIQRMEERNLFAKVKVSGLV